MKISTNIVNFTKYSHVNHGKCSFFALLKLFYTIWYGGIHGVYDKFFEFLVKILKLLMYNLYEWNSEIALIFVKMIMLKMYIKEPESSTSIFKLDGRENMKFAILNGKMLNRSEAKVDIEDRGYQFGDGVYEVIRVYNGKLFTLHEHLNRFEKSAENIGIALPYSEEDLIELLEGLVVKNNLQMGTVYLQLTRGVAPRNHAFPVPEVTPTLVAYTKEVPRPIENLQIGVKTILTEDIRWLRCDIKSLNLLPNLLAKQKAANKKCFEAIQYRDRHITEGSSSNVFIVKNGEIITHPSTPLILKGITKDVIFQACLKNNLSFVERPFTIDELVDADEVFMSSTTAEVMSIVEIDEKKVNNGKPGPITKQLQELFEKEIEKQCGPLQVKILL